MSDDGTATSSDDGNDDADHTNITVSEEGARQLLQLMIRRGYFRASPSVSPSRNNVKEEPEFIGESVDDSHDASATTRTAPLRKSCIIPQLDHKVADTFEKFQQLSEKDRLIYANPDLLDPSEEDASTVRSSVVTAEDCERNTLIPHLSDDVFYTPQGLAKFIENELLNSKYKGRMSVQEAISSVQVHGRYLQEKTSLVRQAIEDLGIEILHDADWNEIFVSTAHWSSLRQEINAQVEKDGFVPVADLATKLKLSLDVVMTKVLQIVHASATGASKTAVPVGNGNENPSFTVICQDDVKALVSEAYLAKLQEEVITTFQSMVEPTTLATVCKAHGWDRDLVLQFIGNSESIEGELHADATGTTTSGTAMFVPHTYVKRQRQAIEDFFAANGFLTAEVAQRHGVLPQQMIQWICQRGQRNDKADSSLPSLSGSNSAEHDERDLKVVVLAEDNDQSNVVLLADHICENLHVAIQECCGNNSLSPSSLDGSIVGHTVDLQEYLPAEIVNRPESVKRLLDHIGFNAMSSERSSKDGVAVFAEGQALIINQKLVQNISDTVLPPLIEAFAKTEAEKLSESSSTLAEMDDSSNILSSNRKGGGSGGRKRKGKKVSRDIAQDVTASTSQEQSGVVPLLQVAGAILRAYPTLMPERTEQDLLEHAELITWDDETDGDDMRDILLIQFCRNALYSDEFKSKCQQAIQAESKRLQSLRESKATISRKDAAAKVRTVESSFEEVFVSLCRMIQVSVKFFKFVESSKSEHFDEEAIETLRKEILQGCCADLTSRMTQYILFRNEEEGGIFSFSRTGPADGDCSDNGGSDHGDGNETEESSPVTPAGVPQFCAPLDTSVRRYKGTYLSCPPPREPLPILRESLSGTIGVSLARQWILCGGECYLGGMRTSEEDGTTFVRPGNLESFLEHVDENCL